MKKKKKGFAAMTLEQRRRIASLGGKAAQRSGKAHRYTHDEAVAAGRKGGLVSQGGGSKFTSESGRAGSRKRHRR